MFYFSATTPHGVRREKSTVGTKISGRRINRAADSHTRLYKASQSSSHSITCRPPANLITTFCHLYLYLLSRVFKKKTILLEMEHSDQYAICIQNGMTKVEEGDRIHQIIKNCMVTGLGNDTKVVAIHRNLNSGPTGQVRLESFRIFREVVANKCGGNANVKHAWYGASRDEIYEIIRHGFCRIYDEGSDSYGFGVYLSPLDSAGDCVSSSVPDEHGMRHMLMCQVLLGKMEEVRVGSNQHEPSSTEFDSGVDNISAPRKHIIWGAYMNSHILPQYVVSFKMPDVKGEGRI
ncbi:hypothetical protein Vadar_013627 [Vaccinium darrowii]|uniref:Uncharacterized protein n=1 Tax=Vaccinium darrowii TaxID=229202 RepID=A0ACB7YVL6_9ERIC|nr:hypothetical protein Vadar_013627 [Vaccinium darrowii]